MKQIETGKNKKENNYLKWKEKLKKRELRKKEIGIIKQTDHSTCAVTSIKLSS